MRRTLLIGKGRLVLNRLSLLGTTLRLVDSRDPSFRAQGKNVSKAPPRLASASLEIAIGANRAKVVADRSVRRDRAMTTQPHFARRRPLLPSSLVLGAALLVAAPQLSAGSSEPAGLTAVVLPGPLEIETRFAELALAVTGPSVSDRPQENAVQFAIEDLVINDLNQDGLGWRLTASPQPLRNGNSILPLGEYAGFGAFEAPADIVSPSPDELVSLSASGVAGLRARYQVNFDVPAFAPAGVYRGVVTFSIAAE